MFEVGKDIFGIKSSYKKSEEYKKLKFIYIIFVFFFVIFFIRTLQISIQGISKKNIKQGNVISNITRADIVDRNGEILAKTITSGNIVLRPRLVKDKNKVANFIHKIYPEKYNVSDVLKFINSSKKYIVLKDKVKEEELQNILKEKIDGLNIESFPKRIYPKGRSFSHIIGFVENGSMKGLEGIEKIYDKYLFENKDPLKLSLDSRIQGIFYRWLSLALEKYNAIGATGILMNSKTGEIISILSLPDFDPNNRNIDPVKNRIFTPLRSVFEMGSIFKIFNTALAFENNINHEFYIAEPFKLKSASGNVIATFSDVASFKPPRSNLSVSEIMLYSCNAGSAQIAQELPKNAQEEFFRKIHFDKQLDLDFGKTEKTLMPIKWGPVEKGTISFGHGIAITPIHAFLGINSVISNGIYIYPTIKKRGIGKIDTGKRIVSPDISSRIRDIMFQITEKTTAKQVRVNGISIGGKTGTAEKRVNGKIDKNKNLNVFIGAFPIDTPQYTIMVILDEPKGIPETFGLRTAAWNAVPTAGGIINEIIPLLFN